MALRAPRLVPVLVLALVLGGVLWLVARGPAGPGDPGVYEVTVRDPAGGVFFRGNVTLGDADVLAALEAAAAAGSFEVEVERQAYGAYVRAIGPYAQTATGGWNYCIDSGSGFAWVAAAAADRPLRSGERIEWRWAEDGSEVC